MHMYSYAQLATMLKHHHSMSGFYVTATECRDLHNSSAAPNRLRVNVVVLTVHALESGRMHSLLSHILSLLRGMCE